MFERFTDDARRALTVAQEEAKALDHDFIGTEHLLLGLLSVEGGAVLDAVNDMGITLDEARAKVQDLVHPGRAATSGNPPFTPLAKKALERSLRAALTHGDNYIGPEHMLLGLIDVPDGGGAQVLADLAGSLDHAREVVVARLGGDRPPAPATRRDRERDAGGTRRSRLWITRGGPGGGGGGSAAPDPATIAPRCANCKASLADQARHRSLVVPASDDDDEPGPARPELAVNVVYCARCGTTVGLA